MMMKFVHILAATLLFVATVTADDEHCRGKREVRTCNVVGADGVVTATTYNGCNLLCCGGQLTTREAGLQCCGSEATGKVYNDNSQLCCANVNEFRIYPKNGRNERCCGLDKLDQNLHVKGWACCKGGNPARFNTRTQMCCKGQVSHVGNTAFGNCCGNKGYDRRTYSCPCHRGPAIMAAGKNAVCCKSSDGKRMANQDIMTQNCHKGLAYSKNNQFICGDRVGNVASQMCCNGKLFNKPAGSYPGRASCCLLSSGLRVAYNPASAVCCAYQLHNFEAGKTKMCCGGNVYNTAVSGDKCCVGDNFLALPYHSGSQTCCNGHVGVGDGCCGSSPYYSAKQKCCAGNLANVNFEWPSCCGNVPFDAYVQSCCGGRVMANPTVPGPLGLSTSHFTRCCANEKSVKPYDYYNGVCCGGMVHAIGYGKFSTAGCCGGQKMDMKTEVCCSGVVNQMSFGQNSACCGGRVYDSSTAVCCNGGVRSLDGVAPENAVCCGDLCIDGTVHYCCGGLRRSKAGMTVSEFNRLSCNFGQVPEPVAPIARMFSPVVFSPPASAAVMADSPIYDRAYSMAGSAVGGEYSDGSNYGGINDLIDSMTFYFA